MTPYKALVLSIALAACGNGDPSSPTPVPCAPRPEAPPIAATVTFAADGSSPGTIVVYKGDTVRIEARGGAIEPGTVELVDTKIAADPRTVAAPALKIAANQAACVQIGATGEYGIHSSKNVNATIEVRSRVWRVIYGVLDFSATKWLFLALLLVMPLASLLTWAERRQSAMMQDRLGPNRASLIPPGKGKTLGRFRLFGILHFVADAVKMMAKEDFVPANVHRGLFALAPILALAPVLIAFAIIPFGPTIFPHALFDTYPYLDTAQALQQNAHVFDDSIRMQIFQVDFGLIYYFAVLTLANYGGTIAGWASFNKWALLGGLRSSSQMMSYEVAMGLSLMGVFLWCGSLEPGFIAEHGATATFAAEHQMQASNPLNWFWLWQPVGLVLFFTAAIAETKRAPFDIPEGEPEIIGYFVEYSGMRWGMFFLAEFIEIVFISAVIATIFFGGYQFPFLDPDGFRFAQFSFPLQHWAVVGIQFATFGLKVVLLSWFQLMIRWTLPRFRVDQLMNLGWKLLLPLALANVMVTALIRLIFM
jgi:NADH-quinone oxidoreductase subunit H